MRSKAALFWNESFLWGIMAVKSLKRLGLAFELLSSEDIREGRLMEFGAVVVPGGWASNKLKALGDEGGKRVREFVFQGGSYFGLCGGAGLATMDGLGLIDAKRKPLPERVPSLSGPVRVRLIQHPLWEGIREPMFHIWWPSQFEVGNQAGVFAEFENAEPDSFSSDIRVGDMTDSEWERAEMSYGINLNPKKMAGSPLVIEGGFGRGKVIASLIHFDTPGDANGEIVLKNLWAHLGLSTESPKAPKDLRAGRPSDGLYGKARELFEFGIVNSLWFERGPLINWRRGIRGLEYYTLYKLMEEIARQGGCADKAGDSFEAGDSLEALAGAPLEAEPFEVKIEEFVDMAKRLLTLERDALLEGRRITFSSSPDAEITALRSKLFADSKSYGGFFKEILDKADAILFSLLQK